METASNINVHIIIIILPYPLERGPMGGAPDIGPRLGGWADIRGISIAFTRERAPR